MITATEFPSAVAIARFVRVSPTKARRVIDLVRGKSVSEALDILRWAPQAASVPVAKVIASAAANAQNNNGLDPATLVVATVYADGGPTPSGFVRARRAAHSGSADAPATSPWWWKAGRPRMREARNLRARPARAARRPVRLLRGRRRPRRRPLRRLRRRRRPPKKRRPRRHPPKKAPAKKAPAKKASAAKSTGTDATSEAKGGSH